MPPGRPVNGAVLALAMGLLTVAAGVTGFSVGKAQTPSLLAQPSEATTFPVALEPFADSREVTVVPTASANATMASPVSGILNATTCRPGGTLKSGTAPWTVSGTPVMALATSEPLFRDLASGSKGSDVKALQRELNRLGYQVPTDGIFESGTGAAIDELRRKAGLSSGRSLGPGQVTWLPGAKTVATSCAGLGASIGEGAELAKARGSVAAAQIKPLPSNAVPGARSLTIGGERLKVDDKGSVASADLGRLAALPITAIALETAGQENQVPLSGTWELRKPLQAATIPASAVVSEPSQSCVSSGGRAIAVTIVSSQVGRSVVTFEDGATPELVDTNPNPGLTCS